MPLTITKSVRPNATWQEMYLQVRKGQRVIIAADGLWSPEMRPATIVWCGPDGIEGRLANEDYLLPGTNVGALVGRVGEEGPPIAVGCYHAQCVNHQGAASQLGKALAKITPFRPRYWGVDTDEILELLGCLRSDQVGTSGFNEHLEALQKGL